MDVQIHPGYFVQLVADAKIKNNTNSPSSQVTYLISLENLDGTSQIIQLSEEEAKYLGILSAIPSESAISDGSKQGITLQKSAYSLGKNLDSMKKITATNTARFKTLHNNVNNIKIEHQTETSVISTQNKVANVGSLFCLASPKRAVYEGTVQSKKNSNEEQSTKTIPPDDFKKKIVKSQTSINMKKHIGQSLYNKNVKSKLNSIAHQSKSIIKVSTKGGTVTTSNGTLNIADTARSVLKTPTNTANLNKSSRKHFKQKIVNQKVLKNPLANNRSNCSANVSMQVVMPKQETQGVTTSSFLLGTKMESDISPIYQSIPGLSKLKQIDASTNENIIKENSTEPLGSCKNPIEIIKDGEVLHSTQNLGQDYLKQIAEALQLKPANSDNIPNEIVNKQPNVIYRVVYPEELDLNPKPKLLKRGRPRKRLNSESFDEKPQIKLQVQEDIKPTKNMRTRSGRITRPPLHIKKDFKKIETSETDMEMELKTVEFEPLKTNQPPTTVDIPVQVKQLEIHQRKRSIASQFRCPKCQKAYLGHSMMLKHLQKHPDHGPIPEHCKSTDDKTWTFLIGLCNKKPLGQRGLKFCRELNNFLHNVRMLAKLLFKQPSDVENNLYFVDDSLGSFLGIQPGNYVLNESELHTETGILSFINNSFFKNGTANSEDGFLNSTKNSNDNFDIEAFVKTCQTLDSDTVKEKSCNNLAFNENRQCKRNSSSKSKIKVENLESHSHINENHFNQNKLPFINIQDAASNGFNLNCDITSVVGFSSDLQGFSSSNNVNNKNASSTVNSRNSHTQGQEDNDNQKPINSDLSLHSELLSENSLLNSLPNLRTSVEELILNNVDGTQVTNLLDNSTSSDEVMNVDQFVNERFKNLTESDLELPNTSLNLDLPSLDLFQFHTS